MTTTNTLTAVVQTAAQTAVTATATRDHAIIAMRLDGASLRTIGKAAGLSAQGVRQILNRAGHK